MKQYSHDSLTFEVTDLGPTDGRTVILLHGFPEDRHCWDPLAGSLVGAGCHVLAPDQRGYSPHARPSGRRAYTLDRLAADVLALANTAGVGRFDLVGHDWGASLAWYLAGTHPDRVRTLTALSVPHSRAFAEALTRSSQALHSWYILALQIPKVPELVMGRAGVDRFADQLARSGLNPDTARHYAARVGQAGAMTGPINWYRALPFEVRHQLGPITPPTLFVWGARDQFVTRTAAARCIRHVSGPYRFVALPDGTHWLPSDFASELAPLLLDHLTSVAA
jgi:pimeloyl-ACP methyl ester carboxylesterase